VWESGYGQHEADWIGFYDFLSFELGLSKKTSILKGLEKITRNGGWFLPHRKICWICERHNVLHRNDRGQLHRDGSAALEYPDGFSIYALNGIRMRAEYVTTPAEKLEPEAVLKETNADIRRELIRKAGIERMLSKLPHKVLDKCGDYELYSIDLGGEARDARYLKMLNPSIGVWHMEGEPPEIDTVEKALNRRNGGWFKNAEILT